MSLHEGHVTVDYKAESCVLIAVKHGGMTDDESKEYLDELEFLAETAGAFSSKRFVQNLNMPDPRTYVGSGKIKEIKEYCDQEDIDILIFDDELSPSQLRNIEAIMERKVLDRNNLILDIFASRARSSHARTQVELAQLKYLLPRLTRLWTHLERQKGGIGMRGPGETQIETDRRIISQRIAGLEKKLKSIDKQMAVQRGNRGQLVRVAIVGYTNVGKSTIMNRLAKSEVFAENKLFATLDTTVRKVVVNNLPFLLTDTVGFIRKLPTQLVESFKSTLDEVREADMLIHVLDISHPNFEDHYNVVNQTLAEIDDSEKPTMLVFNKIDAYKPEEIEDEETGETTSIGIAELKKTWMSKLNHEKVCFISATNNDNIDTFKEQLYEEVKAIFKIRYPYNNFLY